MIDFWPHQQFALDQTPKLLGGGVFHWCVCSPTGGGKSAIIQEEIRRAYDKGYKISIYSFRKLLTNQLIGYLEELRIPFGVRAAEFEKTYENHGAAVQLISPQTEASRIKSLKWELHESDLVIVDEAHQLTTGRQRELIQEHEKRGSAVVEYTATVTKELRKFCQELVIAGTNSELRKIGALLPAMVYDCGCMDLDKVKRHASSNEFNNTELRSMKYVQAILGNVIKHYEEKNPERLPTLLFAPGVQESIWFVDRLAERGHKFAHIDGTNVYVDGEMYESDQNVRDDVIRRLVNGDIQGIANRFVLREAVNIPEIYCAILATPIGSHSSYVQVVGRSLRACKGMGHVKILDHGGSARRHGSPNEDWDWEELSQMTNAQIESTRRMRKQNGRVDPGTACPKCGKMYSRIPEKCECGHEMRHAYQCPECGKDHEVWPVGHKCRSCGADMRSIRRKPVIQHDGTMELVPDSELKEKPTKNLGEKTQGMWNGIIWPAIKKRKNRTFAQWYAYFIKQHIEQYHCRPPRDLKMMPTKEADWSRRPCDVPLEDLRGHKPKTEMAAAEAEGW